jgi:hypothetical protein
MGHGAQHLEGYLDGFLSGNITRAQVEANNLARYENPIGDELGEYTRKNYDDASRMYRMSTSTDWGTIVTRPWWHYIAPWNWGKPGKVVENQNPWTL